MSVCYPHGNATLIALALVTGLAAQIDPAVLTDLKAADPARRGTAIEAAAKLGPNAITDIGRLLTNPSADTATAAQRALWGIAHQATAARPGHRTAVSAALLSVAARDLPTARRDAVLRMVAITGDDQATVNTVVELLGNPSSSEMAWFVLERIDHPAADRSLIAATGSSETNKVLRAVQALGARRSATAVTTLLRLGASNRPVASAARSALARIGDPQARRLLRAAVVANGTDATDHWLVFLERRRADGDPTATLLTDYQTLHASPLDHVRVAGLEGQRRLLADTPTAIFGPAVAALADRSPRVRATARAALCTGGDLGTKLLAELERAKPEVCGEILSVLTRRGDPGAEAAVRAATQVSDPTLRGRALALCGHFASDNLVPLLLAATKDQAAPIRAAASASLCAHGQRRLDGGNTAGALPLLHQVLASSSDPQIQVRALDAVGQAAAPESLAIIAPLASRHREPVASARLAIAANLRNAKAERDLLRLVCETSRTRDTRKAAAARLRKLGVDTADLAALAGFVTKWQVIGPFAKCDETDLGQHPFGNKGPRLEASYPSTAGKASWQPLDTPDLDGIVDLRVWQKKSNASAYAFAEIHWPRDEAVTVLLGSDDGVAVWLNGALVHANHTARGVRIDDDKLALNFRSGSNQILVKVNQGSGDWGFCLRIADHGGHPIDLRKRRSK